MEARMSPAPLPGIRTDNRRRSRCRASLLVTLAVLVALIVSGPNSAFGLTINQANHWRDISTPNTVGFLAQDVLFFGALSVLPAGDGTSVSASQGGVTLPLFFLGGGGGDIFPGQYGRSIPYNAGLTGSWSLTGTLGPDTATATTPAPGGVASMPFANNVTISGTGLTPTISWTNPPAATIDRIGIAIFDDEQPANPRKPIIFETGLSSPGLSGTATSFTVPAGVLQNGHRYVARVELVETYGHALNGGGELTRSRSNGFFSLVPLKQGAPTVVYLPIVDGSQFRFDFAVDTGRIFFVDPPVAIGYQYAVGTGNPNFASVLLPSVGDGQFDLFGCSGASLGSATAGVAHFFGAGGVSCFKVL